MLHLDVQPPVRDPQHSFAVLNNIGLKVDKMGRLSDWADRPGHEGRPASHTMLTRTRRVAFTAADEQFLLSWYTASRIQGRLSADAVFEQLECLRPSHSWAAYRSRWRQGDLAKRAPPTISHDEAFAGLHTDNELDPPLGGVDLDQGPRDTLKQLLGDHTAVGEVHQNVQDKQTYNDFKVDTLRVVRIKLQVENEEGFRDLLAKSWVVDAHTEFVECWLQHVREAEEELSRQGQTIPNTTKNRSQYQWKIDRTMAVIEEKSARYCGHHLDKQHWATDDHEVRCMVQLTLGYLDSGLRPTVHEAPNRLEAFCVRSFWLMRWFRWVHKTLSGDGKTTRRQRSRQQGWRDVLQDLSRRRRDEVRALAVQEVDDEKDDPIYDSGDRAAVAVHCPSHDADLSHLNSISPASPEGSDGQPSKPRQVPFTTPTTVDGGPDQTRQVETTPEDDTETMVVQSNDTFEHTARLPTPDDLTFTDGTIEPARTSPLPDSIPILNLQQGQQETRQATEAPPGSVIDIRGLIGPDAQLKVPEYRTPQSRGKLQQRGIFWLTEEAYSAYKNQRDRHLAQWGVTAAHGGTCVLVPAAWADTDAVDVMDAFSETDMAIKEVEESRLPFSLADTKTSFARAMAWFETWPQKPRRAIDLDVFQATPNGIWPEMHGSHLCHHGLCVNPNHVVYEHRDTNLRRNVCNHAARVLRTYGQQIPEHCVKHDPPCLLQHASLTTHEAFLVQFSVLRQARGLPGCELAARPPSHPSWFATFEGQLPLQINAPAIRAHPDHLVNASPARTAGAKEKLVFRCIFCLKLKRTWAQVTTYWSHLKTQHLEVSKEERLREITRTAREYQNWVKQQGWDYERDNPQTWSRLAQAQASNFDWDVVETWRLRHDRTFRRANAQASEADGAPTDTH